MEEFKAETSKDETLQRLSRQVVQGWPDSVRKIVPALKPYWPLRDDISVEDGLILLGSSVIVPESLRDKILQQIHGGHFGIEKCKLRAKSLQCDNSTQFTSGEFQQLASLHGFEIVTSSLHYPRGHGFVEGQVQTVKKTILKCRETKEDICIDLALLAL